MNNDRLDKYIKDNCLDVTSIDMDSACKLYISEMERKLSNPENKKELLPSYLSADFIVERGKKVAVLDAGGTNLRTALIKINADLSFTIDKLRNTVMPGSQGKVTKDFFFNKAVEVLKYLLDETDYLSICFSYPLTMSSRYAGSMIQLSKQLEIDDITGCEIILEFKKALIRTGSNIPSRITILNDSVAVLMGGIARSLARYDGYMGFILGTGVNMAYIEDCNNLLNISRDYTSNSMAINVEASRYCLMPRGRIDNLFDAETLDPGDYLFEKMLSGKFLGPLFLCVLQDALNADLFSEGLGEKINNIKTIGTYDITSFFYRPEKNNVLIDLYNQMFYDTDRKVFQTLLSAIIERAAFYCAIAISAVVLKSADNKTNIKFGIIIEGGTIRNLNIMLDKIKNYLSDYLRKKKSINYDFILIENAALIGTAAAAFCG
jgi:hexokinase